MDALGWIMLSVLIVGLAWADRATTRADRARKELQSRRQAWQAHARQREATSVRLQGAKR